jgi:hypothetical protein
VAHVFQPADPAALKRVLEDSGLSYRQNKRSYIFTCPLCQKSGKLMMLKATGKFVCWVCAETRGFRGRPEFALSEMMGVPIAGLKALLYGDVAEALTPESWFRIDLLDYFDDEEVPEDIESLVKGLQYPLDFYLIDHPHAASGLKYLEGRGIPLEVAKEYDLRYCPVQKRVIFPVKVGPKLVGWQARAIYDTSWTDDEGNVHEAPKILTTGPRDRVVMFQDRLAGSDHAIICEGPVDALKCHLAGGAVATMGKVISKQQIDIIRNSGVKRIYLGLDPDAGAETMKLTNMLGDFKLYRLLPAKGYKDLGAMPMELVLRHFESAPRVFPGQLFLSLS